MNPAVDALPPLADEHYVCPACGFSFDAVSLDDARSLMGDLPASIREVVSDAASEQPDDPQWMRRRPTSSTWSVLEYVCHVRDVFVVYTMRLHRMMSEDTPAWDPMFNDLRALRFRYNERDLAAVLDELDAAAAGLVDEMQTVPVDGWNRKGRRLPGEIRSALWLVRQAAHEGSHHRDDIVDVARRTRR